MPGLKSNQELRWSMIRSALCVGGPLDGIEIDVGDGVAHAAVPGWEQVREHWGLDQQLPSPIHVLKTSYKLRHVEFAMSSVRLSADVFVWDHCRDSDTQLMMKMVAAVAVSNLKIAEGMRRS